MGNSLILRLITVVFVVILTAGAAAASDTGSNSTIKNLALLKAVSEGRTVDAERLIEEGARLTTADAHGRSLLTIAAGKGDAAMVRLLLDRGQAVGPSGDTGEMPLIMVAAERGFLEVVEILLDRGADVNSANKHEMTLLMASAAHGWVDVVKRLIAGGADIFARDITGRTPLMCAAGSSFPCRGSASEHLEIVKLLIEKGAHVNARTKNRSTALFSACRSWCADVAAYLISRGAHVNVSDNDGTTPLMVAAGSRLQCPGEARDLMRTFELLFKSGARADVRDKHGRTALMYLMSDRRHRLRRLNDTVALAAAEMLVSHGADVSAVGDGGRSALSLAVKNGHFAVATFLRSRGAREDAVAKVSTELLLDAFRSGSCPGDHDGGLSLIEEFAADGANPDARDEYGRTPLMSAAMIACERSVELLLEHGANVNAFDSRGNAPLALACRFHAPRNSTMGKRRQAVVELLLKHGANVNDKSAGRTPVVHALEAGNDYLADTLKDHGGIVAIDATVALPVLRNALAAPGGAERVAGLLEGGLDPNMRSRIGETLLHEAVRSGNLELVKILVEKGANVNATTPWGATPLMVAAQSEDRRAAEIARYLIRRDARISAKDRRFGRTPLMWAYMRGNQETAHLLIQHGADEDAVDKAGKTARHYAEQPVRRRVPPGPPPAAPMPGRSAG